MSSGSIPRSLSDWLKGSVKQTKRQRARAHSAQSTRQCARGSDGHRKSTDVERPPRPPSNSDKAAGHKVDAASQCTTVDAATQTAPACTCCAWQSQEVHACTSFTDAQVVRLMSSVQWSGVHRTHMCLQLLQMRLRCDSPPIDPVGIVHHAPSESSNMTPSTSIFTDESPIVDTCTLEVKRPTQLAIQLAKPAHKTCRPAVAAWARVRSLIAAGALHNAVQFNDIDKPFLHLTPQYANALRNSWRALYKQRSILLCAMHRMFVRLEKRHDSVRRAFNPNNENHALAPVLHGDAQACMRNKGMSSTLEHSKFVLSILGDIILNIERSNTFTRPLRGFGCKHLVLREQVGMTNDVWEDFGQLLTDTMYSMDSVRRTRHAVAAWRVLIATITDELRFGFAEAVRERRRQRKRDSLSSQVQHGCDTVDNGDLPCAPTQHAQFDQNVPSEEITSPPYQQHLPPPTRAHSIVDRLRESDMLW